MVVAGAVEDGTHGESGTALWLVRDSTVDFKGRPADKRRTGGWKAAPLIFVTEACERLAAFGISLNLVIYLVNGLHLGLAFSANVVTNYLGTSYLACLLGGYVADTYIGRFWTILLGAILQLLGMVVLTLSATLPQLRVPPCDDQYSTTCQPASGWSMATLYIGLYLVAFGTGGIKSSVSPFGADQFDESDVRERKRKASYFNWFFMAIEVGAVLAVTVLVYVQVKMGRGWAFGATAASMLVAIAIFVAGAPSYRYQAALKGSPVSQVVRVIVQAIRNRNLPLPPPNSLQHETVNLASDHAFQNIPHTNQFRFLDRAAIVISTHESGAKPMTVTEVEEVKCVIRMLPIAALIIVFYTGYAQMLTFTLEQGQMMDRGQLGFDIPPASLAVFRAASIMVVLAIYTPTLVPLMRRVTGEDHGVTTLQRIGVGLALSILSTMAAAIVEARRLRVANDHDHDDVTTVPMSVFWLVPQFVLLGAGEAFTVVGQLEFCYQESPIGMRSMATAVFLCTLSFGFFSSSALVSCVNRLTGHGDHHHGAWLASNLNNARLDYFYSVLLAIMVINFVAYIFCAKWYKYKAKTPPALIPTSSKLINLQLRSTVHSPNNNPRNGTDTNHTPSSSQSCT